MQTLQTGQPFPGISARSTDGGDIRLPDAVRGSDAVLLFYRGHW
jgi:peroxiredoxin